MSQKEMPPGDFSLFLLGHSYGQSAFFFFLSFDFVPWLQLGELMHCHPSSLPWSCPCLPRGALLPQLKFTDEG